MAIGEKIQKLRKQRGLSQEALAEKVTVTRQTISKWELGQSTPDLDFIAQLSDIFNVSSDYLIKDEMTEPDAVSYTHLPAEFLLTKSQYQAETGRAVERGALFFQIRQAFFPGEGTPEEANKIGYETAMRWTKGKYQFFVCTHTCLLYTSRCV